MTIDAWIDSLVQYAVTTGLAQEEDRRVLTNRLMDILRVEDHDPAHCELCTDLEEILAGMLGYACQKGLCDDNITARDIFDTRLMGALTPMPREVIARFREEYAKSPPAPCIPYFGSVNTNSAPNALSNFWRSILIELGIVKIILSPRSAAIIARPTPVLPLVGSMIVVLLSILLVAMALSIIFKAILSLTEWLGFRNSHLAKILASTPNLFILISGVLPINSLTLFAIFIFIP